MFLSIFLEWRTPKFITGLVSGCKHPIKSTVGVLVCCFVLLNRYWGIVTVPGFPREQAKEARAHDVESRTYLLTLSVLTYVFFCCIQQISLGNHYDPGVSSRALVSHKRRTHD